MPRTPAANAAQYKYNREHLKRVPLDLRKDDYERLSAAAAAAGESVNGYIKKSIEQRMARERKPDGPILRLEYYVEFGKGDNSDLEDWDVEIPPELRRELDICIRKADWERFTELTDPVIAQAYPAILEKVTADLEEAGDAWSDGYSLVVKAPFGNDYSD